MPNTLTVVMNGVTGRMGTHQHLVRSVLALMRDGGVALSNGDRVQLDPILVGRNESKVRELAERSGGLRWTTSLDEALSDPRPGIYFDAQVTAARESAILTAIAAGKHIYSEKPVATTAKSALRLAEAAEAAGVKNGVVHDKLYLPGLLKLRRLIDAGFFGRILSVRGEFGYWVFEGDWQPAQRPSWNYRASDGGGITLDMYCHWNYVLSSLFGRVRAVTARVATHIPTRYDEYGQAYTADADDAAYGIFELRGGVIAQINSSWCVRVNRDELLEFQVDGVEASAVAGLRTCKVQHRSATPAAIWNPDLPDPIAYRDAWQAVPDNMTFDNGFKAQWTQFIRHVHDDAEHPYDLAEGARDIQLAEAALASSQSGRRVEIGELTP